MASIFLQDFGPAGPSPWGEAPRPRARAESPYCNESQPKIWPNGKNLHGMDASVEKCYMTRNMRASSLNRGTTVGDSRTQGRQPGTDRSGVSGLFRRFWAAGPVANVREQP